MPAFAALFAFAFFLPIPFEFCRFFRLANGSTQTEIQQSQIMRILTKSQFQV